MADQSNEMVRRVARAICRANVLSMMKLAGLAYHDLTVEAEVDRLFKGDLPGARAAIEALRTPTVKMIAAGMDEYEFTEGVVTNVYSAILDAALSHDEVKG